MSFHSVIKFCWNNTFLLCSVPMSLTALFVKKNKQSLICTFRNSKNILFHITIILFFVCCEKIHLNWLFQDARLKKLVEEYNEKWDIISDHFPDRSDVQCQQRWTKVVNPELVKGPWTKEVSNWIHEYLVELCNEKFKNSLHNE